MPVGGHLTHIQPPLLGDLSSDEMSWTNADMAHLFQPLFHGAECNTALHKPTIPVSLMPMETVQLKTQTVLEAEHRLTNTHSLLHPHFLVRSKLTVSSSQPAGTACWIPHCSSVSADGRASAGPG